MGALVRRIDDIRLGIIGMTKGNGHPYSWSAIFNRYDKEAMTKECPFAGIPVYLNKEDYDTIGIPGAKVVMVHCDQHKDAEHVAKLSLVPEIAETPEEMIGKVDAVIIATDIGGEHVRRAMPFIEAGIPLFIDKPLCDNAEDLEFFRRAIQGGAKILSSSCMRYSKEIRPYFHGNCHELGKLRFIFMPMPKQWETYGIHALEAVFALTGPGFVSIRNTGSETRNVVHLKHKNEIDVVIGNISDSIYAPDIAMIGTQGRMTIHIQDSYTSFRDQLVAFVNYLRTGISPIPFSETEELIRLVIGGIDSRRNHGKEILI